MQAPSSPIPFDLQRNIQQYWGCVFTNNQDLLKSMVSSDISVELEMSVNGKKQPVEKFVGSDKLLQQAAVISSILNSISFTTQKYQLDTFYDKEGFQGIEVDYEQNLIVNEGNQLMEMYSKGKQTWKSDGTVFVALKVFESDSFKKPYKISSSVPITSDRTCAIL